MEASALVRLDKASLCGRTVGHKGAHTLRGDDGDDGELASRDFVSDHAARKEREEQITC